jgi:nicotinamidase-related amidase
MTKTESLRKTALIVIDAQESFVHRPYFQAETLPEYLLAQNKLIAAATAAAIPVVRIFHVEPQGHFAFASGLVKPITGLADFDAAATFNKTRHSALVGSGLDVWLISHGIRKLVISGIRTEQCCETTTRHASDLGFDVDYALDATQTFDMQDDKGNTVSAAQIKARTALVLQSRFAQVKSAGEIAASW